MKLATLRTEKRDGELIIVNRQMTHGCRVRHIASTLIEALENWDDISHKLKQTYESLNSNQINDTFVLDLSALSSPLPRSYQWLDGSAFLSHVRRVRKARNAEMPESFLTDPLMYQGNSDSFLGPYEDIRLADVNWGCDYEAEVAIVTNDTPMGTRAGDADRHICLLMLVNDISLRNLIPAELAKGFGFLHGKPSSSFSPIAVTPDELGEDWTRYRLNRQLRSWVNGEPYGSPYAGTDMQFGFDQLLEHACKTRKLAAGTIIGSGTVSNEDESLGVSCLVEKRVIEIAASGEARTEFLKYGDTVKIDMLDDEGNSIFGQIRQKVVRWTG